MLCRKYQYLRFLHMDNTESDFNSLDIKTVWNNPIPWLHEDSDNNELTEIKVNTFVKAIHSEI